MKKVISSFIILAIILAVCACTPEPVSESAGYSEEAYQELNSEIQEIEEQYVDNSGYISEEDKDEALSEVLELAKKKLKVGEITYYEEGLDCVYMELSDDTGYVYIPKIEGTDASGDNLDIATMQPFYTDYIEERGEDYRNYMSVVDEAGKKIEAFSGSYDFNDSGGDDDNYDDDEVDVDVLNKFSQYSVIIWHGHGAYSEKHGSYILTGIKSTVTFIAKHLNDYLTKRFILSNSGRVAVTSKFFDHYLDDNALEGSLVYLGTCSSGVDTRLGDALVNKGAEAVFANTGVITTTYNLSMIGSVFDSLCAEKDGRYTTVSEALDTAKAQNGSHDPVEERKDTHVKIIGNGDYALNNSAEQSLTTNSLPDGEYAFKMGDYKEFWGNEDILDAIYFNLPNSGYVVPVEGGYMLTCSIIKNIEITKEEFYKISAGESITKQIGQGVIEIQAYPGGGDNIDWWNGECIGIKMEWIPGQEDEDIVSCYYEIDNNEPEPFIFLPEGSETGEVYIFPYENADEMFYYTGQVVELFISGDTMISLQYDEDMKNRFEDYLSSGWPDEYQDCYAEIYYIIISDNEIVEMSMYYGY